MRYFALIEKEDGTAFGIRFPDLPGCFSAADEITDIEANATEALALWLEDSDPPPPSDIDALRRHAEIARALASGGFLIAVVVPCTTPDSIPVPVEPAMRAALDAEAQRRGLSRANVAAEMLRRALERDRD